MSCVRALPVDRSLQAYGPQLLTQPRVDCRIRQGVGRFPTGGPLLERNRRVEGAPFDPEAETRERIRMELQISLGQVNRVAVVVSPGGGVEFHGLGFADRL